MGGGESYNGHYVQATKMQSDSNEDIAETQKESDTATAQIQADALVRQAEIDAETRKYEADKNFQIQMEALKVRETEARLTFKVDMKNAQNDAVRAEASMVTAQAATMKAETKQYEAESDRSKDIAKYADGNKESYWYGYN